MFNPKPSPRTRNRSIFSFIKILFSGYFSLNKTKSKKVSIDIPSGLGTKVEFKANMIVSIGKSKVVSKTLNKVVNIGWSQSCFYMWS